MTYLSGDVLKLAAGHNNVNGLLSVHRMPCMNKYYRLGSVEIEWEDYESRELDGSLIYKPIGNAKTTWRFPLILTPAYNAFRIICPNESANVTIRTWNKRLNLFKNYNAVMDWPEMRNIRSNRDEYYDMIFAFRNLILIA